MKLYRDLLEAALDQPKPTAELRAAAAAVMKAIEHSLVEWPTGERLRAFSDATGTV